MTEDQAKEIVRHLEEDFGARFEGVRRDGDAWIKRYGYIFDAYIGEDPSPKRQGAKIVFPIRRTQAGAIGERYSGHFAFPSEEQARAAFVSMQMLAAVS